MLFPARALTENRVVRPIVRPFQTFSILALTSVLLILFQNCSVPHARSNNPNEQRYGGEGADGKRYQHMGICGGTQTDAVDAVVVSPGGQSALLVRENCQDLPSPQPLAISDLNFAVNEASVFVLNQKIFAVPQDGSAGASTGAPQVPNLLANYVRRPSWKVAGVDYPVGPLPGTAFRDPATIAIAGVTVDTATHEVSVNSDNVTLDGFDFSLAGGWSVTIGDQRPAANTKILNSKFKVGANHQAMINAPRAKNLYVGYSILDGNNLHDNLNDTAVFFFGTGLTVEYSWILNSPGDFIESGAGTVLIRYNLFNNNGQSATTPADWLQLEDGDFYIAYDYNTFYQTPTATSAPTDGINLRAQTQTQPSSLQAVEIANNTIVTLASAKVGADISLATSLLTGNALIRDNFADTSGSTAFAGSGSSCALGDCPASSTASSIFIDNVNMSTGALYSTAP